jgi:hypothetical protein
MNWLKDVLRPFVVHFPMLGEITFLPWRFVHRVLHAGDDEAEEIRRYTFFWLSIYLILQPRVLPMVAGQPQRAGNESIAKSFESQLLILVAILLFSLVCWISERNNKRLGIDTCLNLILPVVFTASVLDTFFDWLSLETYRHFGLNENAVFTKCRGPYDTRCIDGLIAGHPSASFGLSLIHSLGEGHFMFLLVVLYFFGLEPLRDKKYLQIDNRAMKAAVAVILYLFCQFLRLHSNHLL